jgi:aryl-alcohol dehydrogenase-like predicted oxidoreductase
MRHNVLGRSSVRVSEIGYGCMSLGHDHAENAKLLHRALSLGVTFFDTADLYDRGFNEESVGRAFKGMREEVVVASKVGNRWRKDGSSWDWDASPAYIRQAIEASLKRLQTDHLDLYQLHGGTLDDDIDGVIETFEDLQRRGLIRAYGISSIRPNVIREWLGRSSMASVMMQYSLLDRRPEETVLDLLHEHKVSVIVRGPVAKGILSETGAAKVENGFLDHSPEVLNNARAALHALATPERSTAQLALRYTLAPPAVATAIPGASTAAQLEENAGAAGVTLTEAEFQSLRALDTATTYTQHR